MDIITTGCFGFCEKGPIVKIIPDNTFYTQVVPDDADEIVREHIIGGRKIERLLYIDPKTEKTVSDSKHMDFYRKQMRIALRNCGFINPENIEEYIALDGYMALADSLLHKKPEEVIDVIKRSGLRGRGANLQFSVDLLAEKLNMSRSSLHRKIKGLSDLTPNDYIRLHRLKRAAVLLQEGNYRVNEIASLTGFTSSSYFTKCFQQHFEMLPKNFAKTINN